MDLDSGQLRAFVAVADDGSFQAAATRLFVSQQAVSKRVARLEASLGTLLERRPSGVVLTALGERVLPEARDVLERADALIGAARGTAPSPLRVDVWGHGHTPHVLVRRWAADHPEVVVDVSMRRSVAQAVRALEQGDLDVALGNVAMLPELPTTLSTALASGDRLDALVHDAAGGGAGQTWEAGAMRSRVLVWPMDSGGPEVNATIEAYAASLGVEIENSGANLGLEEVVRRVLADPSRFTLVARAWDVATDPLTVVALRPALVFRWYAVWRTRSAHPRVASFVRGLCAAGDRSWRGDPDVVTPDGRG